MPVVYIKKSIYNALVRRGYDVSELTNQLLSDELDRIKHQETVS